MIYFASPGGKTEKMDWLKDNILTVLATTLTALATIAAGVRTLFSYHSARLDERQDSQIAKAVTSASADFLEDLSSVRERVASLEAHLQGTRETLTGMHSKLDDMDGHLRSLPEKLAEALKK